MSNDFLVFNGTISGSLNMSGSFDLGGGPLNISEVSVLPSGNLGDLIVSGSNLYFYNGTDWMEMYGNIISTMTPTPEPDYSITSTPTISPTPTPTGLPENDPINFGILISGSEVDYNAIFSVVGTSITVDINITSILPSSGVTIDVSVKKKADNTVVFSTSTSSSIASNPVTITGLTPGVLCVATAVVTSINDGINTSTKTFELAAK
jgi:hypothetical protein